MFKIIGRQALEGALEKLHSDSLAIGESLSESLGIILSTVKLPLEVVKLLETVPDLWASAPKEQKQAFFNAALGAGTKALATYAGS